MATFLKSEGVKWKTLQIQALKDLGSHRNDGRQRTDIPE